MPSQSDGVLSSALSDDASIPLSWHMQLLQATSGANAAAAHSMLLQPPFYPPFPHTPFLPPPLPALPILQTSHCAAAVQALEWLQ